MRRRRRRFGFASRVSRLLAYGGAGLVVSGILGCSVDTAPLPAGVQDPATFKTPAGALAMYQQAVFQFQRSAFPGMVVGSGLLTDELQSGCVGGSTLVFDAAACGTVDNAYWRPDARALPEGVDPGLTNGNAEFGGGVYGDLNRVRTYAVQALGALAKYDSAAPPALRGEVYALEGYAEVFLADLFCSGVPLSTLEFEGDYVYHGGSTTGEIYQHAVTLFDSALALSTDSARILNLARVGKGRALLDLGTYAAAAAAVAAVPDTFTYQFPVVWPTTGNRNGQFLPGAPAFNSYASVSDQEGGTGLPYRSSGDPRTSATATTNNAFGVQRYYPTKYTLGSTPSIVLASGIEARLIGAEAALQAGDVSGWLTRLNALRATAITPALPALTDPGTEGARVDTLFAERAAWLFVTGARQGDLRRLIRQYGRAPERVYPTGLYPGYPGTYGNDVTVPVPSTEHYNPLFTGCFDRGA